MTPSCATQMPMQMQQKKIAHVLIFEVGLDGNGGASLHGLVWKARGRGAASGRSVRIMSGGQASGGSSGPHLGEIPVDKRGQNRGCACIQMKVV
jgi:hypothetical protein